MVFKLIKLKKNKNYKMFEIHFYLRDRKKLYYK